MPTNDFIGFASSGSANIMSQADYAAAAEQGDGVQPGMASSKLANKIWRQGANMAAALGRITAARGYDALDNGDLDALQSSVDDAISVGTFSRMYFSQTSGNYTAPRTGIYRITLKGGGGGGGGALTSATRAGGSGGEGAINLLYVTLTKNATYPYIIGAGGTAGVSSDSSLTITSGGDGGTSSITVGGTTYTALGGGGGAHSQTAGGGGVGGGLSASTVFGIPGANGRSGLYDTSYGFNNYTAGGGNRGAYRGEVALTGGGGSGGMGSSFAATAGAPGYILIEYAG